MCRICLASSCKLLSLESYGLSRAYEQLTGVTLEHDDGLPRELCVECACLLDKYQKFRDKAVHGDRFLRTLHRMRGSESKNKFKKYKDILTKKYSHPSYCPVTNHMDIPPNEEMYNEIDIKVKTEDSMINKTNNDIVHDKNYELKTEQNHTIFDVNPYDEFETSSVYSDKSDEPLSTLVSNKEVKIKMNKRRGRSKNNSKSKTVNGSSIPRPKDMLRDCFNVKKLSKEEQLKVIEDRKDKFSNSAFRCSYCYKDFANETTLQLHMIDHSETRGTEVCEICQIRCDCPKKLLKHIDNVHRYQYECQQCSSVFSSRNAAVLHAKWHNGTKYTCKICGLILEKSSSYLSHMRIKHPSNHVCSYCGYSFLGQKGIIKHINTRHYNESQSSLSGPWCTMCDVQFSNEDALITHNGIKHTNTNRNTQTHRSKKNKNSIKVLTTNKGSVIWKAVKRRQNTGDDVGAKRTKDHHIPCEVCNTPIPSWHLYRVHLRRAHPNNNRTFYPNTYSSEAVNMCDKCGNVFKYKSLLVEHLRTHSDTPLYKCGQCEKTFNTQKQHKAHAQVHTEPSYACPTCGKTFKHKCNRDRHYNYVHTDEKPYKCENCDKYFKTFEQRKLHTKHIHMKEPWPKRSRTKHKHGDLNVSHSGQTG